MTLLAEIEKQTMWEWSELSLEEKQLAFVNFTTHGIEAIAKRVAVEQKMPMDEAMLYTTCLHRLVKDEFCGTVVPFFEE